MPFLTLYLSKKMGMSNEMIGVYVMLSLVAAACGGICGGFLADKIGRKKVIVYSQLIAAALVFTCLFLQGTMILPAVLIAAAFFHMGMNPAMNALVADVTKPEVRTVSFSLIYLAINVGAAIGPLVAGFLFNHYINLLFILDAVITVIATCVVIFFVKETIPQKPKKEKTETSTTSQNSKWKELAFLFSFRLLIMFGIVLGFANVTYAQHYYSVPLFINQIFGEEGPAIFGSIITINCVVVLVCTVFVTSIIKRFKPLINTLIGVVLQGFGMVLLFTAHSYLFLAVYTVVFTL